MMITFLFITAIVLSFILGISIYTKDEISSICSSLLLIGISIYLMGFINSKPRENRIKVQELERNTVFYINTSDSYKPLDTVWVNMKTQTVDPIDSTAIMCVVLNTQNTNPCK